VATKDSGLNAIRQVTVFIVSSRKKFVIFDSFFKNASPTLTKKHNQGTQRDGTVFFANEILIC
jgi:hypothetical protein